MKKNDETNVFVKTMETIAPNEQRQQNGFVPKISGGRKGGCFIAPKLGDAAIKDLIARQGPSPFLNVDPNAKARIGEQRIGIEMNL